MKIGIIHFDDIHIIPHFIAPVKEMYADPEIEVDILTFEGEHKFLKECLNNHNLPTEIIKELPTYFYRKIIEKLKSRRIPSPLYLFKKHADYLLNRYDALIFNDINHEYLYRHKKGEYPKFVLLMHGAGDGEYLIGETYKQTVGKFDLITTSGQKVTEFFKRMQLPETQVKICGYQKFDLIKDKEKPVFFDNDKPVILYNPHFKPELSSWYKYGLEILEFFAQNPQFNLIFAPHINLFNKRGFLKPDVIPKKYFNAPNIRIDLGSKHAVNMDYTLSADIYLGDVSSQIYEFLYKPRPAVFIDAHHIDWQENPHYKHWHLGEVIPHLLPLSNLLETAQDWQQKYREKQREMMEYTFNNLYKSTASLCITQALKELTRKST